MTLPISAAKVLARIRAKVPPTPFPIPTPDRLFEDAPDWLSLRPGEHAVVVGREDFYLRMDVEDTTTTYRQGTAFQGVVEAEAWAKEFIPFSRLAFVQEDCDEDRSVWIAVLVLPSYEDWFACMLRWR